VPQVAYYERGKEWKEIVIMSATDAAEILKTIIKDGQSQLERSSIGLAFSGFAAGLCISFSTAALAVFAMLTGGGLGLIPLLFYPLGYLIVFLGQMETFTIHTVNGVSATFKQFGYWRDLLRLWVVVFVFNLLGTAFFAVLIIYGKFVPPSALEPLFELVDSLLLYGFWGVLLRGVVAGWMLGLMVWLAASSKDTISVFFSVYTIALLIPAGGFPHCIVDSDEFFVSLLLGKTSFWEYLGGFLLPATLGNAIGGIVLVTLLNWGQVLGSEK
jgi:formate/nitrite transporter FocA (FNT family)